MYYLDYCQRQSMLLNGKCPVVSGSRRFDWGKNMLVLSVLHYSNTNKQGIALPIGLSRYSVFGMTIRYTWVQREDEHRNEMSAPFNGEETGEEASDLRLGSRFLVALRT
uniref:AlNc14C521G12035 protein n=1 Tax=Albugo laibachii Nc14 TaxID=890382 RepID=F0X0U3_9STRA|nr:AlNc14C521G12035 [Albugo laibachii Nc14]|eukprot:CCA27388.1 AlNc14C521G12035 [Albugo laibachii Nc14]